LALSKGSASATADFDWAGSPRRAGPAPVGPGPGLL